MYKHRAARRLAFATILIALPGLAAAADLPQAQSATAPAPSAPAVPDWIVTIGGGGGTGPAWPGATQYFFTGSPRLSIRKGQLGTLPAFSGTRDGVGIPLFIWTDSRLDHHSN